MPSKVTNKLFWSLYKTQSKNMLKYNIKMLREKKPYKEQMDFIGYINIFPQ